MTSSTAHHKSTKTMQYYIFAMALVLKATKKAAITGNNYTALLLGRSRSGGDCPDAHNVKMR